uniref:Transmembrane protein 160 n=1 Tax=Hucho hucho TaxID=62062 RepID=A0A4W5JQR8_9TELE
MAALSWFTCRQLPRIADQFARVVKHVRPQYLGGLPARRVHGSPRKWVAEKGPWGKARMPEYHLLSELDKADALMLKKSHETGFLSWFRNGLLATGIGVIAFVQSDVGREAGYGKETILLEQSLIMRKDRTVTETPIYKQTSLGHQSFHLSLTPPPAFFILGGVCVSFGGASYVGSLFSLRRMMLLSLPAVLLNVAVVSSIALFWLCAVSLYIGRLEVEIIHDEDEDDDGGECPDCRDRGNHSHGERHHGSNKGQDK